MVIPMARILVTGATGQIGSGIVAALPGSRALVRARAEIANADVVIGSFDDAQSLHNALAGVDTLFLTGRDNPDQVEQHLRVLGIARERGVQHVVKLSAIGARQDSPVALMRWHDEVEATLRDSGLAWTLLKPHLFMQNLLRFAGDVAQGGVIRAPMGEGRFPLVDTRDVSAAAVAVLRDPGRHAGRAYALTGPEAVSYHEVAAALGARYEPVSPGVFNTGLRNAGIPEWRANDLATIAAAYSDDENEPTGDLPSLLGRPATTLGQFFADHRDRYETGESRSHL